MKLLIDIPEKEYNRIKGKTEVNYSEMWIAEGTPLDGLTNGEVMQKMFPNAKVTIDGTTVCLKFEYYHEIWFDLDWWNAKWGE